MNRLTLAGGVFSGICPPGREDRRRLAHHDGLNRSLPNPQGWWLLTGLDRSDLLPGRRRSLAPAR